MQLDFLVRSGSLPPVFTPFRVLSEKEEVRRKRGYHSWPTFSTATLIGASHAYAGWSLSLLAGSSGCDQCILDTLGRSSIEVFERSGPCTRLCPEATPCSHPPPQPLRIERDIVERSRRLCSHF